ncbi:unnamed protein product [Bursaphelenchus okinawaensis]|uniref:Uncharacterized protein n=1 Tax=Bursaphelenchus okinawaensis TaxID=465554 RepID=A0A811K9K9_9BILA|nr:unnamed protein product [Bursaphelenchus okinawaensis]CAG9097467.1 unnamed protein product [Bursaphelenchus okinawaensis]
MEDVTAKTENIPKPDEQLTFVSEELKELRNKIQVIEADLFAQRTHVAEQSTEIFGLNKKLKLAEAENATSNSTLRDITADNTRMRNELEAVTQERDYHVNSVKDLESQLTSYKEQSTRLEKTLELERRRYSEDKSALDHIQKQNIDLKNNARRFEIENERLKRELQLADYTQKQSNEELVQYLAERDNLKYELQKLSTKSVEVEAVANLKVQEFEIGQKKLNKDVEDYLNQIEVLKTACQKFKARNEQLTSQLELTKKTAVEWERRHAEAVESYDGEFGRLTEVAERSETDLQAKDDEISRITWLLEGKTRELEALALEKDQVIQRLQEEVHNVKEDLRLKEEMYQGGPAFSTAAQETLSLLKNAQSLTEIYRSHIQVKAELAKKTVLLEQADTTLTKLQQDFLANSSALSLQTAQFEETTRELQRAKAQLKQYKQERDEMTVARNACQHELQFITDELEKYQGDCRCLSEQIQNLLRQDQDRMEGENIFSFSDIKELQSKNLELVRRLNTLESEKEAAIKEAEDLKFKELKDKLTTAEKIIKDKEWNIQKLTTLYENVHEELKASSNREKPTEIRSSFDFTVTQFNDQAKNLEALLQRLKDNLEKRKAEILELSLSHQKEEQRWAQNKEALTSQLNKVKAELSEKLTVLTNAMKKEQELKYRLKESEVCYGGIKTRLEFVEKKKNELLEREKRKDEALADLRSKNRTMEVELKDLTKRNDFLKAQLTQYEKNTNLSLELKTACSDLEALIERQKVQIKQEADLEIRQLSEEVENLKSKQLQLTQTKETLENELKITKTSFENEVKRLKFEVENAEVSLEPIKNENQELKKKIQTLTKELLDCQKNETEVTLFETNNSMLMSEIEVMNYQLDATERLCEFWKHRWFNEFKGKVGATTLSTEEQIDYAVLIKDLIEENEKTVQEANTRVLETLRRNMDLEVEKQSLEASIIEINKHVEAEKQKWMQEAKEATEKFELRPVKREYEPMELEEPKAKAIKIEVNYIEEELRAELSKKQNEISGLREQIQSFKKLAESDRVQLIEDLKKYEAEKKEVWARLDEFIKETTLKLESNAGSVTEELLETLRKGLAFEINQRLNFASQVQALRLENQDFIATQLTLRTELNQARKEISVRTSQLEQTKSSLLAQIDKLKQVITEKQEALNNANSSWTARLEQQHKVINQQVETLKKQLSEQSTELSTIRTEKQKVEKALEIKSKEYIQVRSIAVKYKESAMKAMASSSNAATPSTSAPQQAASSAAAAPVVAASFSTPAVPASSRAIHPPKTSPTKPRGATQRQVRPPAGLARAQQQILRAQGVPKPAPAAPLYGQNKAKILKLEEDNKELTTKLTAQTTENQNLKQKLEALEAQIKEKELRIAAMEKKITELEDQNSELQSTIESDAFRHSAIEGSFSRAKQTIEELKKQIETLNMEKQVLLGGSQQQPGFSFNGLQGSQ